MANKTASIRYVEDKNGDVFFPVTHQRGVVDSDGNNLETALASKQDTLVSGTSIKTINGSSILGSGDIEVQTEITMDNTPTSGSDNPVKSGGLFTALAAKQNNLTFDNAPTASSNNPVKSGGVYSALAEKVGSDDIDSVVELTLAQYNALATKDARTMYIISDSTIASDHVGVASLVQTTTSTEDGGTNVWTCTLTNGQSFTLEVKNGNQGNSGYSGAAGELEVVNNLTQGGATAALSAEMGKTLEGEISQLGLEVEVLNIKERTLVSPIYDYKYAGGTALGNGYWAVIHTNTQANRKFDGILKYIEINKAPVSDTSFSIKLYRKVWGNGVITGFTEVQDGVFNLTFPAEIKLLDVSQYNIPIDRDVIIGINGIGEFKVATAHNNYCIQNGAFLSSYQGKFTINVGYYVQFNEAQSSTVKSINNSIEGVSDTLQLHISEKDESIIDYTPAGTNSLEYKDFWAVIHSNTLPDRNRSGILKSIVLLSAPQSNIPITIKLWRKVWENGVITGFTEVENAIYTFIFPQGETSLDVSSSAIVIDPDVVIGIKGEIKYVATTAYKNYCINNGAFYTTFNNKFSLAVDYIVQFDEFDSQRLDEIEGNGNQLNEANVVCLGDSITWLGGDDCDGRDSPSRGWTTYFKEITNPKTIRSYARSGATWSHTAGTQYDITENTGSLSDDNVIFNQINRLIAAVNGGTQATPDIIIIAAGTNDAWYPENRPDAVSVSAATEFANTDSYITSQAIGTLTSIAAAMRYDVEMLKTNYPNAQIIVTTPLQSTKFTLAKCFEVGTIIRECAEYLSIESIDQGKRAGVYRAQEKTGFLFTYDGAHTSALGARMVGQFLARMVNDIYRNKIS